MTRNLFKHAVWVGVLAGLAATDAGAWGPRAQRAITGTALQMIRRTYPNAFKTADMNYEEDVLRGSLSDYVLINQGKPFLSREDAMRAVDNEIALLREVRQYGMGSYFAYRMGVLAGLVSDLLLPYAIDVSPEAAALQKQIEDDIDADLVHYGFTPTGVERHYIRNAQEDIAKRNSFFEDNVRMIADDYARGTGYNGFLKKGGQAFFGRSVEAVADVWHTILRIEGGVSDIPPSKSIVTWYFVDEIQYLLTEKRNFHQALVTYDYFSRTNPDLVQATDRVGDLFYAFGTTEAKERGVHEWEQAYQDPGPYRRTIAEKLAVHFISVGDTYLEKAAGRERADDDLPNALHAFTEALEFDQGNELAAQRVNETNVKVAERKERHDLNVNIIASAEKVMVQAEKLRVDGDFGNAIATYNQAVGLFQAIDDEFPDQANTARDRSKEITYNIDKIINELFRKAEDAIDKGDRAKTERRFEDAIQAYESVRDIVSVIPGDETSQHGGDKKDILNTSQRKVEEAKEAKIRWQEKAKLQEEQAKSQPAAGGVPAAPAPK